MAVGLSVFPTWWLECQHHFLVSEWNLILEKRGFLHWWVKKVFSVHDPLRNVLSNKELVFGFILLLKRDHMESLPEETHPGALPHFAWIRKHWRMSMMTSLTSLLPSRRPSMTGTLSSLVSVFLKLCLDQISTSNGDSRQDNSYY